MDDELFDLLASTVASVGLELVDAELRTGLFRVVVDRPGGADVDAIAQATRAVSTLLDRHDPIPGRRYTLEVTSPGLERPLRNAEHFLRAVGETVLVRTKDRDGSAGRVKGRLVSADSDGFVVETLGDDAAQAQECRFSYDTIDRARTVFEWPSTTRGAASAGRGRSAGSAGASRGAGRSDSRRVTTP